MAGEFSPARIAAFQFALMRELVDEAYRIIQPKVANSILRQNVQKQVGAPPPLRRGSIHRGGLFIPHFWAVMVHDGHRSFGPKKARFLVYFRNWHDDPRKPNPERARDVRRLTKAEFDAGMEENRRLYEINPLAGMMQHMIIVKTPDGRPAKVGPSTPKPFFAEGGKEFVARADAIVARELDRFVRENLIFEEKTIRIRI